MSHTFHFCVFFPFFCFRVKLDGLALLAAKETQATEYDIEQNSSLLAHLLVRLWLLYDVCLTVGRVPMDTAEMSVSVVFLERMETR